jgi:hypothetical protein
MSEEKKRSRLYIYGERTTGVSILVPESKKAEITAKFYEILKEYENPKMLDLSIIPKQPMANRKVVIVATEIEPVSVELREDFKTDDNIIDDIIVSDFGVKITTGKEVSSLPKDKKKIDVGLYSGSGKFYTNKIVSNELKILEWTNIESAKSYLENLK